MPYDVSDSQPDCKGWATVKKNRDGSLETIGCHRTKKEAIAQMVAVSIATEHERTRVVAQARGLITDAELLLVEIAHRRLQLRYNPDQPRDENGRWSSSTGMRIDDPASDRIVDAMQAEAGRMVGELFGAGRTVDDVEVDAQVKALSAYRIEARLGDVSTDDLITSTDERNRLRDQLRVVRGEDWRTVYVDPAMLGSAEELGFDPSTARPVLLQTGTGTTMMVLATNTGFRDIKDPRQDAPWRPQLSREIPMEQGETAIRRSAVSAHLSNWATSSNDSDPMSLLMQEAAVAEFGLKNTAGWATTPPVQAKMDELRAEVLPVQQKIVRAMYDETQSTLDRLGIKEISVHRGMMMDDPPTEWLSDYEHDVTTRPLSSWAGNPMVADAFAGRSGDEMALDKDYSVMMHAKVDARQVLSFPGTGLGCHEETEVVLLGGTMRAGVDTLTHEEMFPHLYEDEDRSYNPDQPRDENGRWSSAGGGFAPDDPVMVEVLSTMADDARASGDLFIPDDAPNDQALKARAASAIEARLGDVSTDELIATMGDSKHLNDIKRVFIDGEPWEEIYPDQARVIENPDQYQLRLGVDNSGIVTPYLYRSSTATIHPLGGSYPSADDIDYHDAERAIRTSIVSRHVQQWAQTSNDHNARSLLMQEAAQREFGIDDASGWDIKPAQLATEMDSLRPTLLPVQQKIVRAMYDETQAVLAKAGVTELSVVRGMGLESADQLAQFVDKANPISMRPMSSWSTETQTAAMFAGGGDTAILLSTKVPASRILSMPGTGFGCLNEGEVVLLGGTMEADVVTGDEIWDLAG